MRALAIIPLRPRGLGIVSTELGAGAGPAEVAAATSAFGRAPRRPAPAGEPADRSRRGRDDGRETERGVPR